VLSRKGKSNTMCGFDQLESGRGQRISSELRLVAFPLTMEAFRPFGDVIDAAGQPDRIINGGRCERFHDRANLDFSDGRAGISLFSAHPVRQPISIEMVERHPYGSQAFLPMSMGRFLVVVAEDRDGVAGIPRAFVTTPGQGVNYRRNTWHGVLMPLSGPAFFSVVDRIGDGPNVEEFYYDEPWTIEIGDL
jgi:ureidoglycolate lyase